jgi:hypothetical protein
MEFVLTVEVVGVMERREFVTLVARRFVSLPQRPYHRAK